MRRPLPERQAILPEGMKIFLHRRFDEIIGALFFLTGLYLFLSLMSYDISDPSWNTAVDGSAQNMGGSLGAHLSDALLQGFGWSSLLLVMVFFSWARLKITHRPLNNVVMKLLLLPFTLFLLSMVIAAMLYFLPVDFPKLTGVSGILVVNKLIDTLMFMGTHFAWIVVFFVSLITFASFFFYVSGIRGGDWFNVLSIFHKVIGVFIIRIPRVLTFLTGGGLARKEKVLTEAVAVKPVKAEVKNAMARSEPELSFGETERVIETPREAIIEEEDSEESYDFDLPDMEDYQLPPLELLAEVEETGLNLSETELQANAARLKEVLEDFGVRGDIVKVRPGPVVTLYELVPAPGIKSSRIIGLADDIARSMSAVSARVAVIPGRNAIGIELPNKERETVFLRELLSSSAYERAGGSLPLALGKDISGAAIIADLSRMPHLLVAGTTGSGKSVSINTMILSLLYRLPPDRCKLIMIDPKMLELSVYDGIPHLLTPVVTDPRKAVVALKWTVREMENRYRAMSKLGVRNIIGYNMRLSEAKAKGEDLARKVQTGFDPETGKPIYETQSLELEALPYIVVVVDEMADLMLVAGKDIEAAVQRLAQMARAAGIHIVMATQRPSVDVITGTIKANFPTRISFQVTSKIDSRTILGEQGAEQLLGMGDMLYMAPGGRVTRVHGPFVSDQEVEGVVRYLKSQGSPQYLDDIIDDAETGGDILGLSTEDSGDDLYDQAVAIILREGKISTSFIQRHLQIGYNRAARIVEKMEEEGIISQASRTGKREILIGQSGV